MSTSTHTRRGSMPSMANVSTLASTSRTVGASSARLVAAKQQFGTGEVPVVVTTAPGLRRTPGGKSEQDRHPAQPTRRISRPSVVGVPPSRSGPQLSPALGPLGERLAAEHLERLGYRVIARNHRTRYGEIDLIAVDGETLVFCEVKSRRAGSGSPWESLHERKRGQVRRMACSWLAERLDRPRRPTVRFDAIGVLVDRRQRLVALEHLEGAF